MLTGGLADGASGFTQAYGGATEVCRTRHANGWRGERRWQIMRADQAMTPLSIGIIVTVVRASFWNWQRYSDRAVNAPRPLRRGGTFRDRAKLLLNSAIRELYETMGLTFAHKPPISGHGKGNFQP